MDYRKLLQPMVVSALCAGILFSCTHQEPLAVQSTPDTGTGDAVIYLPEIPRGFLAKSLALQNQPNTLTLSVFGEAMDSIHYAWPVDSMPPSPVIIHGIPARDSIIFEGALTNSSGIVAYSGQTVTLMKTGEMINVHLYLHLLNTTGNASVCIEIEGLPSQCSHDTIDTQYPNDTTQYPNDTLLKCFHIDALDTLHLVEGAQDTVINLFTGDISLTITGSSAYGKLILPGNEGDDYDEIRVRGIVTSPMTSPPTNRNSVQFVSCHLQPVDSTVTGIRFVDFQQEVYSGTTFSDTIVGVVIVSVDDIDKSFLFSGTQKECW